VGDQRQQAYLHYQINHSNFLKNKQMKKRKFLLSALAIVTAVTGSIIYAADHVDSPAVTGSTTDITDVYAFRGQDQNNLVFVGNTQGLLTPGTSAAAKFDENTLIEFNIDNNGDAVEDLVIQAIPRNGKMKIFGPYKPAATGTRSTISNDQLSVEVEITKYGETAKTATAKGITAFAGPRDDPFFFDLDQFRKILAGTATGFNNPGTDFFKGTNVMSVIVEVPKSILGGTDKINIWLETKKKL
jgi:Domain of unknown function (DUF4331)